jgi:hypothetical protein
VTVLVAVLETFDVAPRPAPDNKDPACLIELPLVAANLALLLLLLD